MNIVCQGDVCQGDVCQRDINMWNPFRKKKIITTFPEECMEGVEFNFNTLWEMNRREVTIITDKGPIILRENSGTKFFIEVSGDNINPLKLEVIPDFNNKTLNFVEIVDPNAKLDDVNKGNISFVHESKHIDMLPSEYLNMSIDKYANTRNKDMDIEKMIRRTKRRRNIFLIMFTILSIINVYVFTITDDISRYINIIAILACILASIYSWNSYKKMYETYEKYKELRSQMFEIVREK